MFDIYDDDQEIVHVVIGEVVPWISTAIAFYAASLLKRETQPLYFRAIWKKLTIPPDIVENCGTFVSCGWYVDNKSKDFPPPRDIIWIDICSNGNVRWEDTNIIYDGFFDKHNKKEV